MSSPTHTRYRQLLPLIFGNGTKVNITSRDIGRRLDIVISEYLDFFEVLFSTDYS